jgi:hypothetical protein
MILSETNLICKKNHANMGIERGDDVNKKYLIYYPHF